MGSGGTLLLFMLPGGSSDGKVGYINEELLNWY